MSERVAIVGMGVRVRGARDVAGLERRLVEGPVSVPVVDRERWDERRLGPAPRAILLEDHEIEPRALRMPPLTVAKLHRMERSVMAAMLAACEDAGLSRESPERERTSVHVGATTLGLDPNNDHIARVWMPYVLGALEDAARQTGLADDDARRAIAAALEAAAPEVAVDSLMTTAAMAAGRVANALDLGGGHASYDAGFAASLAALIAGFESVRDGESDCAIVAGVSPLVTATQLLAHARRGLLSTDAEAWARGRLGEASGTVLGEGALAVVLRREGDALVRGTRVYAIVEGHGTASAGARSKSRAAEACTTEAAQAALLGAGVAPRDVDLLECQGAGLPSADTAERAGLINVYGEAAPLRAASGARRFGFLGAASGMLSVVVAALSLSRRARPGRDGRVQRAAVSSPGLGDVAHHLILAHPEIARPPSSLPRRTARAVAVTGMGAKVPGADSTAALLRTVTADDCHVHEMPASRLRLSDHLAAESSAARETALAALMAEPARDARRLKLPPVTVAKLDGAVVLATAVCEQALGDAALDAAALAGRRTGVWVGHLPLRAAEMEAERAMLAKRCASTALGVLESRGVSTAGAMAFVAAFEGSLARWTTAIDEETLRAASSVDCAARVAAMLDLRGGVVAVDAACASSLVALHLARRALLRREVDVAVVAGVAWNLFPEYYAALATLGALSYRGSRPFDVAADGMVPGEGACALVLEREDEREGARLRARVLGSGLASDGRGAAVLAPNTRGQERALRRAQACAGVGPETIDVLEAHGTGTAAGDAVEVETYARVFAEGRAGRPLWLGSVKSNIGHLSSGAGLAGIVKAVLSLEQRTLLPTRHAGPEHAPATLAGGVLALPRAAAPWPAPPDGRPRRAGVSSFGLGGIDAHVVLEEVSLPARPAQVRSFVDPLLSAGDGATRLVPEVAELMLPPRDVEAALRARHPGALLIVPDEGGRVARAVEERLGRAGLVVLPFAPDEDATFESLQAALLELSRSRGLPTVGVLDLGSLRPSSPTSPPRRLASAAARLVHRGLGVARALAELMRRGACGPSAPFLVVATGGGGGFGLESAPASAEDGAAAGLLRAVALEVEGLRCRAVDLDPTEPPDWLAETLLAEATAGGTRVEVGYRNRRRLTVTLRAAPRRARRAAPTFPRGAVLFSGGSRGVVKECALRLAREGVPCVITGRTPLPRGDEAWAHESDAALAEMRRVAIQTARERGETPKEAARRVDGWLEQRALARALREAEASGLPIEYHRCDVTDPKALSALARELTRRHGALAGVVHGAMQEQSRALEEKRADAVQATLDVKLTGLVNLLELAERESMGFVIAFGSIAGRLGNVGQADYAAANAAMGRLLAVFAAQHPEVRCATFEWSAWSGVGAAAEPAMAALLASAGVVPISKEEGSQCFVEELATGLVDRFVVLGDERSVIDWPRGIVASDVEGEPARAIDDRGLPIDPGRWPLIDRVREDGAVERAFSYATDPFLADHHFEGSAVLPGAFALELLLESALVLNPGCRIREAREFRLEAPLRISESGSVLVRTTVTPASTPSGSREFEVEARVALRHHGVLLERDRPFCSARVSVSSAAALASDAAAAGPPGTGPGTASFGPPDSSPTRRRGSIFEQLHDPVHLGPRFHHIAWLERREAGVRGVVRPPPSTAMHARTRAPQWLVDPLVLDAAFQVASHWAALRPGGTVAVPLAIDRVELPIRRSERAEVAVEARLVTEAGPDLRFDVRLTAPDGSILAKLDGLTLRRAGAPLEAPAPIVVGGRA